MFCFSSIVADGRNFPLPELPLCTFFFFCHSKTAEGKEREKDLKPNIPGSGWMKPTCAMKAPLCELNPSAQNGFLQGAQGAATKQRQSQATYLDVASSMPFLEKCRDKLAIQTSCILTLFVRAAVFKLSGSLTHCKCLPGRREGSINMIPRITPLCAIVLPKMAAKGTLCTLSAAILQQWNCKEQLCLVLLAILSLSECPKNYAIQ